MLRVLNSNVNALLMQRFSFGTELMWVRSTVKKPGKGREKEHSQGRFIHVADVRGVQAR
jgi:hypothetical protein